MTGRSIAAARGAPISPGAAKAFVIPMTIDLPTSGGCLRQVGMRRPAVRFRDARRVIALRACSYVPDGIEADAVLRRRHEHDAAARPVGFRRGGVRSLDVSGHSPR